MPVERVSSIYDINALQSEQGKFIKFLQDSKAGIIDLNNQRVTAKGADLSSFTKATQDLNQAINNTTAATNKAVTSKRDLTKAELEARLATQQRTAAIKNEIIETNAAKGSYNQLQAQLKRLQDQYKSLSQVQRLSTPGRELNASINSTKTQLKDLDKGIGDHQRNVGNYTKSIGSYFEGITTRVLAYSAAYLGINAVKDFFTSVIDEALEAEKASIRFRGTLDNLGRVDAFDRLQKKAVDLANQFKYLDNDEITGIFEKLVTYGKLSEDQISQLTPVIINFAAKTGQSIGDSASLIIKALEGNGKALKEFGIDLKEGKTEAERFGIVMNDLGEKVNGAADAFGETTQGKIAATRQRFKDLKEEIGIGLLPVLNKVLEGVNGLLLGFKRMSEDGIGEVLRRTGQGALNAVSSLSITQGFNSEKFARKQAELIRQADIVTGKGNYGVEKTNAAFTFVDPGGEVNLGGDKPFGKGDSTTAAKAKALKDESGLLNEYIKKEQEQRNLASQKELQLAKDTYQALYTNQENSEQDRLDSLKGFYDVSSKLIAVDTKGQLDSLDVQIKIDLQKARKIEDLRLRAKTIAEIEKVSQETQANIITEGHNKQAEEDRNFAKNTIAIVHDGFIKDEQLLKDHVATLKQIHDEALADEIASNNINANELSTGAIQDARIAEQEAGAEKRKKIETDLQYELTRIQKEGESERLAIEQEDLLKQSATLELLHQSTLSVEAAITDNRKKQAEIRKQIADDEYNYQTQKRNQLLDEIEAGGTATLDLIQSFGDAGFQRQKDDAQKELDILDAKTRREIELENASADSTAEKADKIAIINARAQAEREALDLRQRKADHDKAVFDKQIAILQVIAAIAVDIAKGQFFTAALAGAALIKLIATRIPAYKGGRGEGKEEFALVGDGGVSEYIHRADGTIEKTPSVETLTHLMPKDRVYKDRATMMRELAMSNLQLSNLSVSKDGSLKQDLRKMTTEIVGAVENITIPASTQITKAGWRYVNEKNSKYDQWVNKNIRN